MRKSDHIFQVAKCRGHNTSFIGEKSQPMQFTCCLATRWKNKLRKNGALISVDNVSFPCSGCDYELSQRCPDCFLTVTFISNWMCYSQDPLLNSTSTHWGTLSNSGEEKTWRNLEQDQFPLWSTNFNLFNCRSKWCCGISKCERRKLKATPGQRWMYYTWRTLTFPAKLKRKLCNYAQIEHRLLKLEHNIVSCFLSVSESGVTSVSIY